MARCSDASSSTFGGAPSSTLTTQSPHASPRTTQLSQSMIMPCSLRFEFLMLATLGRGSDIFGAQPVNSQCHGSSRPRPRPAHGGFDQP